MPKADSTSLRIHEPCIASVKVTPTSSKSFNVASGSIVYGMIRYEPLKMYSP